MTSPFRSSYGNYDKLKRGDGQRRISSQELAARWVSPRPNLSILKTGKAKAIRFSTLDAICKALDCQPGDILEYREEESQ